MRGVAEIALFTDDLVAATKFYRGLLGVAPVTEWPGGALFAAGASKLLVHELSATLADGPPNEDHFAFSVEDLDVACRDLQAEGTVVLVEPRDYAWCRSAYLRDPDGRLVELAEGSS